MRRGTYLNVILTVNAVLLTGLLWTQIAQQPVLAETAVAQSRSKLNPGSKPEYYKPNAAQQRKDQLNALTEIKKAIDKQSKQMDEQMKLLESGSLKVEVTNLDDIQMP